MTSPTIDPDDTPVTVDEDGRLSPQESEGVIEHIANQAPDPAAFRELLNITASLSEQPLYDNNDVQLLIDGPATYAAMLEEIGAAERFVHLETYIFADDKIGQKFADALMQKSREGIVVRVIYDSIGSIGSDNQFFDEMRDAGVELIEFNDANPFVGGNPLTVNTRDHRKLLIVDDRIAFTGGVNLSKTYSSRPGQQKMSEFLEDGWRDTHVSIRGPAVVGLAKLFEMNWQANGGAPVASQTVHKSVENAGADTVFVIDAVGGDAVESQIHHAYFQAIRFARDRIYITQAYFVPGDDLISLLRQAAMRGIDVRIIVPGTSDSNLVMNTSRSLYGKLLEYGVRIFETTTSFLHAKTAVVDGTWATVGSANLDPRSKIHNHETNVIVLGNDFGKRMEAQFQADLENADEVTLDEWRDRPIRHRFLEILSRSLAYFL